MTTGRTRSAGSNDKPPTPSLAPGVCLCGRRPVMRAAGLLSRPGCWTPACLSAR
ncbi:MAG: hypothetical protein ACK56F_27585 [bacterium]